MHVIIATTILWIANSNVDTRSRIFTSINRNVYGALYVRTRWFQREDKEKLLYADGITGRITSLLELQMQPWKQPPTITEKGSVPFFRILVSVRGLLSVSVNCYRRHLGQFKFTVADRPKYNFAHKSTGTREFKVTSQIIRYASVFTGTMR